MCVCVEESPWNLERASRVVQTVLSVQWVTG